MRVVGNKTQTLFLTNNIFTAFHGYITYNTDDINIVQHSIRDTCLYL